MTDTAKMWIWVVLVIGGITAAIVGFVLWDEARTSERLSAETAAVGFQAVATKWYDSADEETVEGHTLTYAYTAGEKVYTRTLEEITWYDSTTTYKVCYNPADPDDSKLYRADHRCGS